MHIYRRRGIYYIRHKDTSGKWWMTSTNARTKSEALALLSRFKQRNSQKPELTLRDLVNLYLAYSHTNHAPLTTQKVKIALTFLLGHVHGKCPLADLDASIIESYKAKRLTKVKPVTLNSELRHIKAALNKAVQWGHIQVSPMRFVPMIRVPQTTPPTVPEDQLKHFFSVLEPEWLKSFVIIALYTGLRRNEIINLCWKQVDMQARRIWVANTVHFTTKTRLERAVPLAEPVYELLNRLPKTSGYVLTRPNGKQLNAYDTTHKVKDAMLKAGLDKALRLHSLRHTFATYLLRHGATLTQVQKLLGHTTVATTMRYDHTMSEEMQHVVDKLPTVDYIGTTEP